MRRILIAACAAAVVVVGLASAAMAVSDGNYSYDRQGCSGKADLSDQAQTTEPGCHSAAFTVADGNGHQYANAGTDQTADGTNVHSGSVTADPGAGSTCTIAFDLGLTNGNAPGTPGGSCAPSTQPAADPTSGLHGYFGADDNLDGGEHDSSGYSNSGPSDGGGIQANADPASFDSWLAMVMGGDVASLLTHPAPVVAVGIGACADGYCADAQTQRRVIYQGSGSGSRDVTDYSGKTWDPYSCGGPTDGADSCGGQSLGDWNKNDGTVYAEPGVQVYEDPDPQGSPIDPLYDNGITPQPNLYPAPAAYVGTCGVRVGGGPVAQAPSGAPATNDAGQVGVSTGC